MFYICLSHDVKEILISSAGIKAVFYLTTKALAAAQMENGAWKGF